MRFPNDPRCRAATTNFDSITSPVQNRIRSDPTPPPPERELPRTVKVKFGGISVRCSVLPRSNRRIERVHVDGMTQKTVPSFYRVEAKK